MSERAAAGVDGPGDLPVHPDLDTAEDVEHRPDDAEPGPRGRQPRRRRPLPQLHPALLAVIFAGGVVGGLARYGITSAWPTPDGAYPWATFTVNTAGAGALGLLLVLLAEVVGPNRYLRPLLGTGVLGAFTTFSSVMTATDELAAHGHPRTAWLYLSGSLLAGLGAASFGILAGRAVATSRRRATPTHREARR